MERGGENVRFGPKATELLRCGDLPLSARTSTLARRRDAERLLGHRAGACRQSCMRCGLRFRRDASRYVRLVHLYRAFVIAFLWGGYHQVLGPSLHPAKFADSLRRYSDVPIHLDPHLIWQATKSYVERGRAFWLVSHYVLPHWYGLLTHDLPIRSRRTNQARVTTPVMSALLQKRPNWRAATKRRFVP